MGLVYPFADGAPWVIVNPEKVLGQDFEVLFLLGL